MKLLKKGPSERLYWLSIQLPILLGVGNLVQVMILYCIFQRCGHQPVALVGGSKPGNGGRSIREVSQSGICLSEDILNANLARAEKSNWKKFLDFYCRDPTQASIVQ
jgi:hypothetical protein